MNRWDQYLTATVQLDDVRRESAGVVAHQQAAATAMAAELTNVRQRIALQRGRLVEVAAGAGRTAPSLDPVEADRLVAAAHFASPEPAVGQTAPPLELAQLQAALPAAALPEGAMTEAALEAATAAAPLEPALSQAVPPPGSALDRRPDAAAPAIDAAVTLGSALQSARGALDAADATLSTIANGPNQRGLLAGQPPGVRNAIVYGWFALLALVAVIEINAIAGPSVPAGVIIAVFSVIVPALAWVLGWICLRLLFGRTGSLPVNRGRHFADRPSGGVVGALLCAVPLVIGLILSAV
jgi:hypothetical protein